jgi:hypothetical protein
VKFLDSFSQKFANTQTAANIAQTRANNAFSWQNPFSDFNCTRANGVWNHIHTSCYSEEEIEEHK